MNISTRKRGRNLTFFEYATAVYGSRISDSMKYLAKLLVKLANFNNRRTFLIRCKHFNIIPQCLTVKAHCNSTFYNSVKINKLRNNFSRKLLMLEIDSTIKSIKHVHIEINNCKFFLKATLPVNIFKDFISTQYSKYNKNFQQIKVKNIIKFNKLLIANDGYRLINIIKINLHSWLKNTTDIDIPMEVACVLALGSKFHFNDINNSAVIRNNLLSTLANIEFNLQHLDIQRLTDLRSKLIRVLQTHLHNFSLLKYKNTLHCSEILLLQHIQLTKSFLKHHPDLICTKADKGNVTVLMLRSTYFSKTKDLLFDRDTYTILSKDPTNTFQSLNNKLVDKLIEVSQIPASCKYTLKTHNSLAPKLYCLPKIHKINMPLRPIVSNLNTPNCKISKFLANILSPLKYSSPYFLENSFQLVDKIKSIHVPQNYRLISLDVVSLFTSIPHNIIIHTIQHRWLDITKRTSLSLSSFIECIKFILQSSYFQFNSFFFSQKSGVPMGSQLSPILAELVLQFLEVTVFKDTDFHILFYFRYVDDILVCLPENNITSIFDSFNSFNPQIQFTLELESNKSINFLDVTLIRLSNSLTFDWYRKPTASGRYLSYFDYSPKQYKISVIISLVDRVLKLSHSSFHKKNFDFVVKTLVANGYPTNIIYKIINDRSIKLKSLSSHDQNDNDITAPDLSGPDINSVNNLTVNIPPFLVLPYHHNLVHHLLEVFKDIPVKLIFVGTNSLRNLFSHLKSPIPRQSRSNVVYQIKCNVCLSSYIGETCQYIHTRLYQHKYHVLNRNSNHSALVEHSLNTGHKFNFENFNILQNEPNKFKRLFLESCHIHLTNNTVNHQTDYNNLVSYYAPLLDKF